MKKQNFINGAFILFLGTMGAKLLGAIFTIPLANIIGTEGMGYFYTAYDIYNGIAVVSVAGLPVALSRMISENHAEEEKGILKTAIISFLILGIAAGAFFLFEGDWVASSLGNPGAAGAVRFLAPACVFIGLSAAFRGYFQGKKEMMATAVSQILEGSGKVVLGLSFAWLMFHFGGEARGAQGASLGIALGCIASAVYLVIHYYSTQKKTPVNLKFSQVSSAPFGKLLRILIPISIGVSVLAFLNLADSLTMMRMFQNMDLYSEKQVSVLYGIYGNARKLYNLPISLIVPLTVSVVPYLTGYLADQKEEEANRLLKSAFKISNLFAMPASIGLFVLAGPIYKLLYFSDELHLYEGKWTLTILSVGVFFGCMTLLTGSILQSAGKEWISMLGVLVGVGVKMLINITVLSNSNLGIFAGALSTDIALLIMMIWNLICIRKQGLYPGLSFRDWLSPLLASGIMGVVCLGSYRAFQTVSSSEIILLPAILIGILVYFWILIRFKIVTSEELSLVPGGKKISGWLERKEEE